MATYTSIAMMRTLLSDLKLRLPSTYIFTESVQSGTNNPVLTIQQDSVWAADEFKVTLVMTAVGSTVTDGIIVPELAKNSLGQTQTVYTPHQLNIAVESSLVTLGDSKWIGLVMECVLRGLPLAVWVTAPTVDPNLAAITGAPTFRLVPSPRWPLMHA